jgi:hypothetical protein
VKGLRERFLRTLQLDNIERSIAELLARRQPPPPAPPAPLPPFVSVLVLADTDDSRGEAWGGGRRLDKGKPEPTALGASYDLDGERVATFIAQVPLVNVRLIVFCDLRRVEVTDVVHGTTLLGHPAMVGGGRGREEQCPIAFLERWEPGETLRVRLTPRVRP